MALIPIDSKDEIKSYADKKLKEAKETEANTKLFKKRINSYTIVYCKKEKDIEKYERQLKTTSIITKQD